MKLSRILLPLFLLACALFSLAACEGFPVDFGTTATTTAAATTTAPDPCELLYIKNEAGDGYLVDGYLTVGRILAIPDTYEGKPVVGITAGAFRDCTTLQAVTVPNSAVAIAAEAFLGCTSLERITLPLGEGLLGGAAHAKFAHLFGLSVPASLKTVTVSEGSVGDEFFFHSRDITKIILEDGVTEIGESAFYECYSLEAIEIGCGVTRIGSALFGDCRALQSITVASGNPRYHSEDNCLIETAEKTLIAGCMSSIIPRDGSVTKIGDFAFQRTAGLCAIDLPEGITSIGSMAFADNTALTAVQIPDSVTVIGGRAFGGCQSLGAVSLGSGVTEIGAYAFSGCRALAALTLPEGLERIGTHAFSDCESLTAIRIPDTVIRMDNHLFDGCTALTAITFPTPATWRGTPTAEDADNRHYGTGIVFDDPVRNAEYLIRGFHTMYWYKE